MCIRLRLPKQVLNRKGYTVHGGKVVPSFQGWPSQQMAPLQLTCASQILVYLQFMPVEFQFFLVIFDFWGLRMR